MSRARDMANLGSLTATVDELNKLDGFTGVVADLNYAKDLNATGVTSIEFDHLDGVTAGIQTQFTVTDKSSIFSLQSNVTQYILKAFAFNGFMFVNFNVNITSPSEGQDLYQITDSNYRPTADQYFPTIGYSQDSAQYISFKTDGVIDVVSPYNPSGGWNCVVNGWYRFD